MTAPMNCQVIGRWRIVEADLWDRDYLDLVEPAYITFDEDGRGEFAFEAVNGSWISNTAIASSSSRGPASTRWTRSAAQDQRSSMTTAPWRSNFPSTLAMRPS